MFAEEAIASAPPKGELDAAGSETLGRLHFDLARVHARLSQPAGRRHAAPFDIGDAERARRRDLAFAGLWNAIAFGWRDPWEFDASADLAPLHADPRWKGLLACLPRK